MFDTAHKVTGSSELLPLDWEESQRNMNCLHGLEASWPAEEFQEQYYCHWHTTAIATVQCWAEAKIPRMTNPVVITDRVGTILFEWELSSVSLRGTTSRVNLHSCYHAGVWTATRTQGLTSPERFSPRSVTACMECETACIWHFDTWHVDRPLVAHTWMWDN